MHKVIVINLNGNAYQLDEPGFEHLRTYLDRAAAELASNPDKEEILADIEQAIADKCQRFLAAHKTVITNAEIEQVLAEMGSVEGAAAAADDAGSDRGATGRTADGGDAPKRLYQIREGSMISGVCNGIAAYFNIDATIVRVAFVLFALLTHGLWILVYIVLMFVIPFANTSEERAAAHGVPFNAQQLIDQAKRNYAAFKESHPWKWPWAQHRPPSSQQQWRTHGAARWGSAHIPAAPPAGYATQLFAGILAPVCVILGVALFFALACAVISLLMTGTVFHWPLPPDMPLWAGILLLVLAYHVVAWPLRAARHASYFATGHGDGRFVAAEALLSAGFGVLFAWLAYHYIPEVHSLVNNFATVWPSIVDNVQRSMH